ncbi:MAG: hypothetical protein LBC73_09325 [Oscillospiraceae bacterium]|nr:hypothetical protein [Oscillospiraceae bacterium]
MSDNQPTSDTSSSQKARNKRMQVRSYMQTRVAAFIMTVVVIAGQTWIAHTINLSFAWVLPIISGVLLIASVLVYTGSHISPSKFARALSISVVVLLPLINLVCIIWFIYDMLNPVTVTVSQDLLLAGFALWVVNIGVFSLAYWETDTGGPEIRRLGLPTVFHKRIYPDFVFPQQSSADTQLHPENWTPGFIDYLYLSFTTAIAFSPTALNPYTHIAKIMAGVQSLFSLFILGLIISRAISL